MLCGMKLHVPPTKYHNHMAHSLLKTLLFKLSHFFFPIDLYVVIVIVVVGCALLLLFCFLVCIYSCCTYMYNMILINMHIMP